MTTSSKFKNSVFAVITTTASLLTVNGLALADSEASLQAGSQATTENSDMSQHSSTSTASTQNGAEAAHESSSGAATQNQSQASVEAGRPIVGPSNIVPGTNPAPFAVGREAQNLFRKNNAMTNAPHSASVKSVKPKTVTYHWGRTPKSVATTTRISR